MYKILQGKLDRAFRLTFDLVDHLEEDALQLKLQNLPSNSIAGQLWCIIGARESYLRAIEASEWKGFSCSLANPITKADILKTLESTFSFFNSIEFSHLNEIQRSFAFDLLEHEIQHHGQLIRFVYGNRLTFPKSWNARYTV